MVAPGSAGNAALQVVLRHIQYNGLLGATRVEGNDALPRLRLVAHLLTLTATHGPRNAVLRNQVAEITPL